MRPTLYMNEICPSSRAVLLTARALELTLKTVTVKENDQTCKVGPQHVVVPTLQDSGYVIWDSHAIIAYLVGKYGKDDSLYPRDLQTRTAIDQRLFFDSGVLSFFAKTISNHVILDGPCCPLKAELVDCLNETYEVVENFFTGDNQWIAADRLTIADLSLLPSITSLDVVAPIDRIKFPKVKKWIERAEDMPFYQGNLNGLRELRSSLK